MFSHPWIIVQGGRLSTCLLWYSWLPLFIFPVPVFQVKLEYLHELGIECWFQVSGIFRQLIPLRQTPILDNVRCARKVWTRFLTVFWPREVCQRTHLRGLDGLLRQQQQQQPPSLAVDRMPILSPTPQVKSQYFISCDYLLSFLDCGQATVNRIVGGQEATENQLPWQCSIYNGDGTWYGCGATLISCDPVIIISAAHCFTGANA